MRTRNKELTQQLQTSNVEIGRVQVEASHLRDSGERGREIQFTEIETQKIFEI